jgi:uncharacterized protein YjiS (DUF1127 family)
MKALAVVHYYSAFDCNRYESRHFDQSWRRHTADTIRLWYERSRQRRQLAELPDHRLRDIGVTYAGAQAEAVKPFWQA